MVQCYIYPKLKLVKILVMQCTWFGLNLLQCFQISKRFSQNWFNVALIFFFFELFAIDGSETVHDGVCHNCVFHCSAGGTEIVSKIF